VPTRARFKHTHTQVEAFAKKAKSNPFAGAGKFLDKLPLGGGKRTPGKATGGKGEGAGPGEAGLDDLLVFSNVGVG